jgi:hypothetical protein
MSPRTETSQSVAASWRRALTQRLRAWRWSIVYDVKRALRRLSATLFRRRATRLLHAFLAQHPSAESASVYDFVSALATAFGAEWELATPLRDVADAAKDAGTWQPDDPRSVEQLTEKAEAELRTWMDEHPGVDPRDESVIDEIAESWVPVYNYERLRVAMESSLWLIAGEVNSEANSVAELLGIAIAEWIKDALYEHVEVEIEHHAEGAANAITN